MSEKTKIIYARVDGLRVKQAREGWVLLNPEDNTLHTLNSSAGFIFELCDGHRGPEEIADVLRERFDLPSSPLNDVKSCLEELSQKGILNLRFRQNDEETVVRRSVGGRNSSGAREGDPLLERLRAELKVLACPVLCEQNALNVHYIPQEFSHPVFNPSVIATSRNLTFLTRCTNELVLADGHHIVKYGAHNTFNILHYYDFRLRFIRSQKVNDAIVRRECSAAAFGFEDGRIFSWKGSNWVLATGRSGHEKEIPYSPVLMKLNRNKVTECVSLKSPKGLAVEKNWIPFVKDNHLFIIYSIFPLVVYAVDDKFALLPFAVDTSGSAAFPQIRGGSQFIPWNGGYLAIAHDPPIELTPKLYYTHRFVVIDELFRIREISEPFFIQRKGIEFAAGIAKANGKIFLSYGIADRAAAFIELSQQTLSRWLLTAACPLVSP